MLRGDETTAATATVIRARSESLPAFGARCGARRSERRPGTRALSTPRSRRAVDRADPRRVRAARRQHRRACRASARSSASSPTVTTRRTSSTSPTTAASRRRSCALKEHRDVWPKVDFTKTITLRSSTLATLLARERIDPQRYDALVMDTQGSELLVLQRRGARARALSLHQDRGARLRGVCGLRAARRHRSGFWTRAAMRSYRATVSRRAPAAVVITMWCTGSKRAVGRGEAPSVVRPLLLFSVASHNVGLRRAWTPTSLGGLIARGRALA